MTKVKIGAPIAIWVVCGVAIALPLLAQLWGRADNYSSCAEAHF